MTANHLSSNVAWVAIATGIIDLFGIAFIILFFTVGEPFGTVNDICNGLTAIATAVLAWMIYSELRTQSPLVLVVAIVGAIVAVIGSVLVIFGITGWYLAGLYTSAGFALIGVWFVSLNYSAQQSNTLPQNLVVFGMIVGAIMVIGLFALPGIISRIDTMENAPWHTYVALTSGLGYLILYPFWCIFLGRTLL